MLSASARLDVADAARTLRATGPLRAAPMSPLVLALLAGGLTLLAGILVVVIITRLRGPAGPDE